MSKRLAEPGELFTVTDAQLLPDGDAGTSYTLRRLTREKHREAVKQNTTRELNKRTHQKDDRVDWGGVTDDLLDYVVVSWTGIVVKDQPAPCDRTHKMLLDAPTVDAILERAGLNEVLRAHQDEQDERDQSFREPAAVSGVLGR